MNYIKLLLKFCLFMGITTNSSLKLFSQELSTIKGNKPISFTGGLSTLGTVYFTNNENPQRDPFIWNVTGNFNLNIYEVFDIPFSFVLSKENKTFNQPSYQQYGISPSYKSVTLHLGYRNLNFSKYTMSGITFLGAGIEFSPEKSLFKCKAFYGRFARAQQFIPDNMFNPQATFVMPSYERWGYGTMITLGKKDHLFDIVLFKASDDPASSAIPDSLSVYPAENFVVGLNSKNNILKNLFLEVNYALSAFSTDIRQGEIYQETYTYSNNLGFLFTPRSSSQFNSVIDVAINFKPGKVNIGAKYLRIDPEYKSLGTAFINNDVQEFTGNISTTFNENRISLSANAGLQNNNLDKSQLATNKRFISALNYTWLISKNLNLTAIFSNYSTNSMPVQVYMIDSVKYSQVTRNASLNITETFGDTIIQHSLSGMFSFQGGNTLNQTGDAVSDVSNTFANAYLAYRLNYLPIGFSVVASLNYSNFISGDINTKSIGPSVGVNKFFLKRKINTGINATYMNSFGTNANSNQIINLRLFANYKINKYHSFTLSVNNLYKIASGASDHHSQASIAYNLIF